MKGVWRYGRLDQVHREPLLLGPSFNTRCWWGREVEVLHQPSAQPSQAPRAQILEMWTPSTCWTRTEQEVVESRWFAIQLNSQSHCNLITDTNKICWKQACNGFIALSETSDITTRGGIFFLFFRPFGILIFLVTLKLSRHSLTPHYWNHTRYCCPARKH